MRIKNFIFDLGNVLVYFDRSLLLRAFDINKIDNKFEGIFILFNSGKIDSDVFFSRLRPYLKEGIDYSSFIKYWVEIFTLNEFLINFITQNLLGNYKLYILSNTDPLHFPYILNRWEIFRKFNNYILSYEVGVMKPDYRIYRYAIEKYKINPGETLFIDDLIENIQAAKSLGFNVIHFIDNKDFFEQIGNYIDFS